MSNDLHNTVSCYILMILVIGMDKETKQFIVVLVIVAILGVLFGLYIDIDWGSILSF